MIALLVRLVLVSLLIAVAAIAITPASAAGRPTLRAKVSVSSDIVTLGDFFKNAGLLNDVPLFRAPDLGETGSVASWRVIDAARLAGLTGENAAGVTSVTVERRSVTVSADDITKLIAEEIALRARLSSPNTLTIVFSNPPEQIDAHHGAVEPVRLSGLRYSPRTNRFSANIIVDQGQKQRRIRLTGIAQEMVDVATLSRTYARNEIVSRDDVVIERVPRNRATAQAVRSADEIAGKAPRHSVRAGEPLNADDFELPMLVRRGETVTIFFEIPGLTLTARGKALESGVDGDMVNVINSQSKRIVRSRIVGRGKVSVARPTPRILKLTEAGQ